MKYNWDEQLAIGVFCEGILDMFYQGMFTIYPVSQEEQRRGVDRRFINRELDIDCTVEYKADFTAARTGNAYIEEEVVYDQGKKEGWIHKCEADMIVYYVPPQGRAFLMKREDLKKWFVDNRHWLSQRQVMNENWHGYGKLAPLRCWEEENVAHIETTLPKLRLSDVKKIVEQNKKRAEGVRIKGE